MAYGLIVATAGLDHDQILVRVDDGLVGVCPNDVDEGWILIQTSLERSLCNNGNTTICVEVVGRQSNNLAGHQSLRLLPFDLGTCAVRRKGNASNGPHLGEQVALDVDLWHIQLLSVHEEG